MDGLKVFSGSSHPALAQAICKCLGIAPGRLSTTRFSNENLKVRIEENVREQDVFVVQTSAPPLSENIVELLILLDALTHASARRVTAVLPYFPYARSDKKDEPRISITARLMADLVATAGANRVLTIDLHSPQIQGFFSMPADQLTAVPVLCDRLRAEGLEDTVVVAADVGEAKDAAVFAKHLGLPIAVIDKRRSGDEERAEAVAVIATSGASAACSSTTRSRPVGRSSAPPTSFSRRGRAASRRPWSTRCSPARPGATRRLPPRAAPRNRYHPIAATSPKIEVLSVAPLLAETITRIHDGRSVSALF